MSDRIIIEELLSRKISSTGAKFVDHVEYMSIFTDNSTVSVKDTAWLVEQPMLKSCVSLTLEGRKIGKSTILKLKKQNFVISTLREFNLENPENKVKASDIIPILSLGQGNIERFSCTKLGWNQVIGVSDIISSCRKYRDDTSVLRSLTLDQISSGKYSKTYCSTASFIQLLTNFPELEQIHQTLKIDEHVDLENVSALLANALVDVSSSKSRIRSIELKVSVSKLFTSKT